MLNLRQMERQIDQRQFDQLVKRIIRNGRYAEAGMVDRLLQPTNVIAAALGLALQRVVELTYRPTAVADAVSGRLLDLQHGDGLFGLRHLPSLSGSAVALRGLIDLAAQHRQVGRDPSPKVLGAIERGMSALCAALSEHAGPAGDEIDESIARWQLERSEMFHQTIGVAAALNEPETQSARGRKKSPQHRSRMSAA